MSRPRKWYVIWPDAGVIQVICGCAAARRYPHLGFKSRLAAEEYAAWWSYKGPH